MNKLKKKDIAKERARLSLEQMYKCPICDTPLASTRVVLDHDHKTGHIRSALCNTCNMSEGKVRKGMVFRAKKEHLVWQDPIRWLRSLANYLEYHEENPSNIIHPNHKGKS